jgi:WD40 repeat protein
MYAVPLSLLGLFPFAARADDEFREFKGHDGPVRVVRFTPDGAKLVSGSGYPFGDGTVRVWDAKTVKELLKIKAHQGNVDNLVLDGEGKRALTASGDKTAKLWNLETGKLLQTFTGHEKFVSGLAFSPDGKEVATGGGDTTVRFWDVTTGKETFKFEGHAADVRAIAYLDGGKTMITASWDGKVKTWERATGKELKTFAPAVSQIHTIALTPDTKEVVIASAPAFYRWNRETGEEVKRYQPGAMAVAVSADGKRILTGRDNGEMILWDLATGEQKAKYVAHVGKVFGVSFAPDGKTAASGGGSGPFVDGKPIKGEDFMVRVWKLDE